MALRSRFALSIAAGLLATAAAATPALADDEWGSGTGTESQGDWGGAQGVGGDWSGQGGEQNGQGASQGASQGDWGGGQGGNQGGSQGGNQQFTPGRVTASTLLLRSAPNRGSQVIRVVHQGDRVRIFCKTRGESVQGNGNWYLLADGIWAWGSARYIDTFGHTPRWC
ncbi:SH3 domain-containing protein [Streptomyces sp. KAU_LT]|uniref:SH3 domain-containing protein n=1 Tax=Streptomyces sp. KAU_LT TaxID=3046669 RepID=UPI0024B68BBF|nr:SH3 domain-containing protein [Streptomyces sp. KAU_LT]MDI9831223.1 SH3 domain-containing protein [Streptomyces sp. KAU_LT]